MLGALPEADALVAGKGHDGDRFREALAERGIELCIPGRASCKRPVTYDAELYKRRNLTERTFGRPEYWRRVATCYDRYAHAFFSAICIAVAIRWSCGRTPIKVSWSNHRSQ